MLAGELKQTKNIVKEKEKNKKDLVTRRKVVSTDATGLVLTFCWVPCFDTHTTGNGRSFDCFF